MEVGPSNSTPNTPTKIRLQALLQAKRRKISKLASKLSKLQTVRQNSNKMSKVQKVILSLIKRKGRRYDNAFKAWALSLYHISGKAYRFLRKLFNLPSKSTLTKVVSRFASDAGFSEKSLFVLKQQVQAMPEKARACTLIMDEMSLKSNLFYDASADSLSGFESFGDIRASNLVANSSLVLMARGLLDN